MTVECRDRKSWLHNSITDDIRDSFVIFLTPILALVDAFLRAVGIAIKTDTFLFRSGVVRFAPIILLAAMVFDVGILFWAKSDGPKIAPEGFAASVWHILRLSQ